MRRRCTEDRRVFCVQVPNRSAPTLLAVIRRHVRPGSILYTDLWKGYRTRDLERIGMTHLTVNHSRHFVDPDTGVHTNTIEGTWAGLKMMVSRRYRTAALIDPWLAMFMWRRRYHYCIWDALIEALQWWTDKLQREAEGPVPLILPDEDSVDSVSEPSDVSDEMSENSDIISEISSVAPLSWFWC